MTMSREELKQELKDAYSQSKQDFVQKVGIKTHENIELDTEDLSQSIQQNHQDSSEKYQKITAPSVSFQEAIKNRENKRQFVKEYIDGMGDIYWISQGKSGLSSIDKTLEIPNAYGTYIQSRKPHFLFTSVYDIKKYLKDPEIKVQDEFLKDYKFLQEDDYQRVCRYQASKDLTVKCMCLVTEQPEKVDKLMPGLSDYIKKNIQFTVTDLHTSYEPEEFNELHSYIYQNMDKIAPEFDEKRKAEHTEFGKTLSDGEQDILGDEFGLNHHIDKLSPEGFYAVVRPHYLYDFSSTEVKEDVARVDTMTKLPNKNHEKEQVRPANFSMMQKNQSR